MSTSLALVTLVLPFLGALVPSELAAQYFGRNKVQYEDFDFRVMRTEHFDVYYYPEEQAAVEDAARMAERWYARLAVGFQHAFQERKPIVFYANHPDFQQTNTTGGFLSESTGGLTESLKDRQVMPLGSYYQASDHVIGHEMVHGFQYDIAKSRGGPGLASLNRVPGWMVEGMAEWFSIGRIDTNTAMWMRGALIEEEFPSIEDLFEGTRFFPYRYGQALWAYIAGRYGDRAVPALYGYSTRQGWEPAVRRVLGTTSDSLSEDWRRANEEAYAEVIASRIRPSDLGRVVIAEEIDGGNQNLAPVLSPDGRYVAFLSERDLFSIDLFLADASTGRVIRTLTSSATSPHFDALSFMNSAGTFSPDGSRFATVVIDEGDNRIVVLNTANGDIERRLPTPGIGAISDPAWSPDGRFIAFSGSVGGITDLYLLDVEATELIQLTSDKQTQLQPAWSPDGRRLAYVTEAPAETDFERLVFGNMVLALLDVETRRTEILPLFEGTKHISPQFAPDGRNLYFVADVDGIPDIFRTDLGSREIFRVTSVATGVSGLTAMSPTLSLAARTGRVAFSVFYHNFKFNIQTLEPAEAQGTPVQRPTTLAWGALPPLRAVGEGMVAEYLTDPFTGLTAGTAAYQREDYSPSLRLDAVGPPTLGVATGTFGTGLAGGISAFFSDMLGDHQMAVAVQANGTVKDIGGIAQYQYRERRWNLGGGAGHIPYLAIYPFVEPTTDGNFILSHNLVRLYVDQLGGMAHYPFSQTRRFEVQGGFTRYAYNVEEQRFLLNPAGQLIDQDRREAPDCDDIDNPFPPFNCAPEPLYLAESSVAYVGDNAVFGFTSPINGGRFRFEASPTLGSLNFQTMLGDYRRYLFRNPVTLAFRGYHIGRYGGDAEDDRLRPLFLGYEWLIRGYSWESFRAEDCTPSTGTSCTELNNLFGSRIALANAEVRVPFLGVEEFGLITFPYVPTELSAFVDAGLAWGQDEQPLLEFRRDLVERVPVVSAGLSARMNVLGFMILEAYYAFPFQRPARGWHWGFNIAPGW
ncbi:MAG: peptidase S9 [Longimicrobiales bacterium]